MVFSLLVYYDGLLKKAVFSLAWKQYQLIALYERML
jgi:hypothetical protein